MDRAKRAETGISNQEIRRVTKFSRSHALRLIKELQDENPGQIFKQGKAAQTNYVWREK